jgi:hypothetical protein
MDFVPFPKYDKIYRQPTIADASRLKKENLMLNKKTPFFHLIFYSCAKNIRFVIGAPTPPPALVIKRLFLALEKKGEK